MLMETMKAYKTIFFNSQKTIRNYFDCFNDALIACTFIFTSAYLQENMELLHPQDFNMQCVKEIMEASLINPNKFLKLSHAAEK